MTDRASFLAKLRDRLAIPLPANLPHPLVAVDRVPDVEFVDDLTEVVSAFERAATKVGANTRRVADSAELAGVLHEVVAANAVRSAVISGDPEAAAARAPLQDLGVSVVPFDSAASCASADLGITGALWGIAATGTLVLHAARAGGRTASLLPPVHLALIPARRILRDAGALFRHLGECVEGELPSQLVLATGPSRSADIELEITVGVHGPREVWVAVLDY